MDPKQRTLLPQDTYGHLWGVKDQGLEGLVRIITGLVKRPDLQGQVVSCVLQGTGCVASQGQWLPQVNHIRGRVQKRVLAWRVSSN